MRKKFYHFFKRTFDIILSFLGIVGTFPIWLIVMLGIFISDPGNVFYVARRVGKDNKEFAMFKFRSMRKGKANESVFRGEEERIFPFGKFIRATKLDELPQLLCCFIGSMSIIGPRPAAKAQVAITRGGEYAIASTVRPGLSGPAALYDYIYGDTITDEKEYQEKVLPTRLALEIYYVLHGSIWYDIKMIWYTVVCVLASVFKKTPKRIFNNLLESAKEIQENYFENQENCDLEIDV